MKTWERVKMPRLGPMALLILCIAFGLWTITELTIGSRAASSVSPLSPIGGPVVLTAGDQASPGYAVGFRIRSLDSGKTRHLKLQWLSQAGLFVGTTATGQNGEGHSEYYRISVEGGLSRFEFSQQKGLVDLSLHDGAILSPTGTRYAISRQSKRRASNGQELSSELCAFGAPGLPELCNEEVEPCNVEQARWSPDEGAIAFSGRLPYDSGQCSLTELYIWNIVKNETHRITNIPGNLLNGYQRNFSTDLNGEGDYYHHVRMLEWSPDGNWIVFMSSSSIYKIRPSGQDMMLLKKRAYFAAWSPDGQYVATIGARGDFLSWLTYPHDIYNFSVTVIESASGEVAEEIPCVWAPDANRQIYWPRSLP